MAEMLLQLGKKTQDKEKSRQELKVYQARRMECCCTLMVSSTFCHSSWDNFRHQLMHSICILMVLGVSNRIIALRAGEIVDQFANQGLRQEDIDKNSPTHYHN